MTADASVAAPSTGESHQPRRGARSARQAQRSTTIEPMLPTLRRGLPVLDPMTEEQVHKIDHASMAILEEVGIVFRDPIALHDWKLAGAG